MSLFRSRMMRRMVISFSHCSEDSRRFMDLMEPANIRHEKTRSSTGTVQMTLWYSADQSTPSGWLRKVNYFRNEGMRQARISTSQTSSVSPLFIEFSGAVGTETRIAVTSTARSQ